LEQRKYDIAYQRSTNLVTGKYKKYIEYYSAIDDRIVYRIRDILYIPQGI
jgi:hypothetical protein